ncbi:MAG: DUF948 domain-containing protein [Nitrospirae bacterium]|nr:DUF948 domain-containing protein [Nitrospirota bacterium]
MADQSWVVILSVGFFIMALGFSAAIFFLIYASLEIRRAAADFREFLKNTEDKMDPVLKETEQTLKSLRKVSDDVGTATGNVRELSDAAYEIVENVKALSGIVHGVREGISLRAFGIKAGVKAALNVLLKELRN